MCQTASQQRVLTVCKTASQQKRAYPMRTSTGSTKMAIWIEEPRATPIARSILFL